jgi:hypothetical protein
VSNNKIKSQIGVFEVNKDKILDIMDEEDTQEPDVSKLSSPLFYGFVNETYIDRYGNDSETYVKHLEQTKETKPASPLKDAKDDLDIEPETDDTDDVMSVKVKPSQISQEVEKANVLLESGIFQKDPHVKISALLPEETEDEAKDTKKGFAETAKHNWVNTFMKNPHYGIHEVESNGDCLFAVIRDAYKQIGFGTSVAKLRAIVAKNATEEIFQDRYKLWVDLEGTIREYNTQMKELKHTMENDLKQRAKKLRNNKTELDKILEETKKLENDYKDILQKKRLTEELKEETMGSLNGIDTLEKFREYIQTPKYWADSWAISVLERVLQVKMIILSHRSYLDHDYNGVLMCGELDKELEKAKNFTPKYYVLATHSGDHYKLITYKEKRILEFQEIPYHIKTLIINKCMERDSGAFYMIPEFRTLKSRMGLDENEGSAAASEEIQTSEYDPKTVFAFYSQSSKTPYPGKGSKETIPVDRRSEFVILKKIVCI